MIAAVATLLSLGCAIAPALSPRDCTPGASSACACPGASGVQTCGDDGTLGACACADGGAPVEDASPATQDAPLAPSDATDAPSPPRDAGAPSEVISDDAGTVRDVPPPPCRWQTCGTACVRVSDGPLNCGGCGHVCAPRFAGADVVCVHGSCVERCREGLVACGSGLCVEYNLESFDCLRCGSSCPTGYYCQTRATPSRCVRD